jgi:poly-gamma-glutamate synthesis protein (capsule biosynthesis protein)
LFLTGDGLAVLEEIGPDARIINLETSVTTASDHWPVMGIYYRMHPDNVPVLTAARVDVAVLSNNHVMNFKRPGLAETLDTLKAVSIRTVGAGQDLAAAQAPAVIPLSDGGRILVYGIAERNSGIPPEWAAKSHRSGLNDFQALHGKHADRFIEYVHSQRQPGDRAIVSIHWGGNWGYEIPAAQRDFAHRLIDEAGVDVVHGHSSHHVKGIEVWNERPIFYGCGDLISDYEGIAHNREYRGELVLMYFVTLDAKTGALQQLEMAPMRVRRFRLQHASESEADWLRKTMNRQCGELGGRIELAGKGRLRLGWDPRPA